MNSIIDTLRHKLEETLLKRRFFRYQRGSGITLSNFFTRWRIDGRGRQQYFYLGPHPGRHLYLSSTSIEPYPVFFYTYTTLGPDGETEDEIPARSVDRIWSYSILALLYWRPLWDFLGLTNGLGTYRVVFDTDDRYIELRASILRHDGFLFELLEVSPALQARSDLKSVTFVSTLLRKGEDGLLPIGRIWPIGWMTDASRVYHIIFAALHPSVLNQYRRKRHGSIEYARFTSEAVVETGFNNIRLAVLATSESRTLDAIEILEQENEVLPRMTLDGRWFRRSEELKKPYLFTDLLKVDNDDNPIGLTKEEVIEIANRGGFEYVLIFANTWSDTRGSYKFIGRYKDDTSGDSTDSLMRISRMCQPHFKLGLHLLSSSVDPDDDIAKAVPMKVAVRETFTLSAPLGSDEMITVDRDLPEWIVSVPDDLKYLWLESPATATWEIFEYTALDSSRADRLRLRHPRPSTTLTYPIGSKVYFAHTHENKFFVADPGLRDPSINTFHEIAERIARICNDGEIAMLYFDGEASIKYLARPWHDSGWLRREVFTRLSREAFITGVGYAGIGWHTQMRGVSDDGAYIATKKYLDKHKIPKRIADYEINYLPAELGWLDIRALDTDNLSYPATQPDEWEYFCSKALGYDVPISLRMTANEYRGNGRADECLEIIGRYERARRIGGISRTTLESLREEGVEFELIEYSRAGPYRFRRTQYGPTVLQPIEGSTTTTWDVLAPSFSFSLQPSIRIRARNGVLGFDGSISSDDPASLLDPANFDPDEWTTGADPEDRASIRFEKITGISTPFGPSSVLLAGSVRRGSRAWIGHRFDSTRDLRGRRSIGLWVRGGTDVHHLLDVQLIVGRTARSYLVPLGFTDWRWVSIVDPAQEEVFEFRLWNSNKRLLRKFNFSAVQEIRLQLIHRPPGGSDVEVYLGPIQALSEIRAQIDAPIRIDINGSSMSLPFSLSANEMIEVVPGDCSTGTTPLPVVPTERVCKKYNARNEMEHCVPLGDIPLLHSGVNRLALSAAPDSVGYAYVTPIFRGVDVID